MSAYSESHLSESFERLAKQLIEAGRFIDDKGWVPATSGNFSARLPDGTILITVSGRHKGRLQIEDLMRVDLDGQALDGKTPSAEALLHTQIYRLFPDVGAVLHPHPKSATLLSKCARDAVVLENYELLKALAGIDTHQARVTIPIFANDQNIARLAIAVEHFAVQHGLSYGYLIAGHGLYTWGATIDDALRHLEALEFLFDCELYLRGVTYQ